MIELFTIPITSGANKGKNYYKDLLTDLNKQKTTAYNSLPNWYLAYLNPSSSSGF